MVLFVFQHFLQSEIWVFFLLLQTPVQKIEKTPNNVDHDQKKKQSFRHHSSSRVILNDL